MADEPGPITELGSGSYESALGQCLNGVCETIIDLDLPGIEGNVWIRDPPTLKGIPLPAIILSPASPSYSAADGAHAKPDVHHRIMVGIVNDGSRGVSTASLPLRLYLWEQCLLLFAKVARPWSVDTPSGAALLSTNIEPGDPRITEAWQEMKDAEYLAVVCRVRYP